MSNPNIDSQSVGSALADALERVGPAVFHVTAGDRHASGVVWSAADHLVITSSRLFHEQRDAAITLRGGEGAARTGTLVGLDEATEVALVKVNALDDSALAQPSWSDEPRAVRVGQFVAPVGRTESGLRTTFGLVARIGPAWVTARGGTVDRYLDIDGTLPPGFSGGPLVDFGGQVLGINTRGLVPGGATIPTATVRRVASLLQAGGTTLPGHLGVAIQSVDLPEHLRAGAPAGLLVTGVVPGSAAERAGIGAGDVIVAIDGLATSDHAHLLAALAGKVGKVVKVRLARHGQAVEVDATPEARAERRQHGGPAKGGAGGGWAPWARAWFGKGGHGCR
ncbi:MAG: trypsin-like peptidase domain-containing protein [Myxococcota bacterium]